MLGHLKICCDKLDSAASFIKKLQITPGERHTGKLWKRLRVFLSEKDLEQLNDQLTLDVVILQLRLQSTLSNAIFSLQQSHLQLERTIGGLTNTIQAQTDVHETGLSTLKKEICDTVNEQSDTACTLLNTMYEVISTRDTIPKSDGDEMITLLKEIKGLLVTPPTQQQTQFAESATKISAPPLTTQSPSSHHSVTDDSCDLIQSIDRLCKLIHDKERVIYTYNSDNDEESQSIVRDLQTILQTAEKKENLIRSYEIRIGPRGRKREYFKKVSRRFMRAFDQKGIAINQAVVNRKHTPHKIARQGFLYQKFRIDIGTITLVSNERTRSSDTIHPYPHTEEKLYSDYSSTFTFFPNDPQMFHMIVASIFQRETELDVSSSISQITVNRVLPYDSRVFQVIKDGDLRELRRMLGNGEASLRDHDEYGASLLFYSVTQPKMCKFLVDNGLDVNHVDETHSLSSGQMLFSQTALQLSAKHRNPENLIQAESCCRILLEAGADRTPLASSYLPFSMTASQEGKVGLMRLAFNRELGNYFDDPISQYDSSLLLAYCDNTYDPYDEETLREILDSGADINARDRSFNNCLHICFKRPFVSLREFKRLYGSLIKPPGYAALKFLIEKGVHVRAINSSGKTVSDYAYSPPLDYRRDFGSCSGDVWDSALHSCGYDIAEFRTEGHTRKAHYTNRYKREDFERLWQGREHFCPYWDDSPWPSLEVFSTDDSDFDIGLEEFGSRYSDREDSNDWGSDSEDGGVPL